MSFLLPPVTSRTFRSSSRHEASTTARRYPSAVLTIRVLATSSAERPRACASASADSVCACVRSSYAAPASSSARVRSSVATRLVLSRGRFRLDPGGARCRRDDALVAVLPAHAEARRLLSENLRDHATMCRLTNPLCLEDDAVA